MTSNVEFCLDDGGFFRDTGIGAKEITGWYVF